MIGIVASTYASLAFVLMVYLAASPSRRNRELRHTAMMTCVFIIVFGFATTVGIQDEILSLIGQAISAAIAYWTMKSKF